MTGVRYWRMKFHLSEETLSKKSDVSVVRIRGMEAGYLDDVELKNYIRIADTLEVSIADLWAEYPEDALEPGDRVQSNTRTRTENINCFGVYRQEKNLSLQQLANMFGITSRERARQVCAGKNLSDESFRKYLNCLAEREGVGPEEFLARYQVQEVEK